VAQVINGGDCAWQVCKQRITLAPKTGWGEGAAFGAGEGAPPLDEGVKASA